MENERVVYAYIKGGRYDKYSISFEGNDELKAIEQDFETLEELTNFVINYSNYCSIPIQFYM